MGIYARRHSRLLLAPAVPLKSDQQDSASGDQPSRVRILSGPLAGLVCEVVSAADSDRWLLRPAWPGVLLRVDPRILGRP